MHETKSQFAEDSGPTAQVSGPVSRKPQLSRRLRPYVPYIIGLAFISTLAGFLTGRFHDSFANWLNIHPVAAAVPAQNAASLVAAPDPHRKDAELEEISHLAPQQQAERLLQLAMEHPDASLGMIHRNLSAWRGHLEETDQLFHLVLGALESDDPRVRIAAVEIDLAACHLIKAHESVTKLLHQIQGDSDGRYMALWRLGAIGNRGVEPATALSTLKRYSRDRNQLARFWAVEGLAMLATRESIDELLDILQHDPAPQIRERAATSLAKSGLLTGEQRLTAIPQLLNLLDDDSVNDPTKTLICSTLETITGASYGKNARAWRDWWAHHDRPEKRTHPPVGLTQT
ncbi:MAG TPA: HEAT repeat domain-containing protein [Candidatus Acidoferrum sp.]|nr:HEAT repeat domain-containing protein [Candidatus Acidoferrum sp.]